MTETQIPTPAEPTAPPPAPAASAPATPPAPGAPAATTATPAPATPAPAAPGAPTTPAAPGGPPAAGAPGPQGGPGPRRAGERPAPRRGGKREFRGRYQQRRKVCSFCADKVAVVDYKDVGRLRRYLTERGKIEPRRKTGTCARHQRALATAIKRARHVALLPFTGEHMRVTGMALR